DLIIDETTVEIDGFGVLTCHQRQGVGSVMQSFAAELAMPKPLILIADGEDSAKDLYVKHGYVFISFCYQIVKEDILKSLIFSLIKKYARNVSVLYCRQSH